MMENTFVQSRAERSIPIRKNWKRRDSRVTPYHNTARSSRNSPPVSSPSHEHQQQHEQNHVPRSPEQGLNFQFQEYYDIQQSPIEPAQLSPVTHQSTQGEVYWQFAPTNNYTLASASPNGTQLHEDNHASVQGNGSMSQISSNIYDPSWTESGFMTGSVGQEFDNLSNSDMAGSLDSLDSMFLGTSDTLASSIAGDYAYPSMDATFGSPDPSLGGLRLPGDYRYATAQVLSSPSPDPLDTSMNLGDFTLNSDQFVPPPNFDAYPNQDSNWSLTTVSQAARYNLPAQLDNSFHLPWNSQQAQLSPLDAGVMTFGPPRGMTYDTHVAGEDFLRSRQQFFGPDPPNAASDNDNDGWTITSQPSSYPTSHNSPQSLGSPPSHAGSPPHIGAEHSHIFTTAPDIPRPKPTRGTRTRNLTPQEKKAAREVRDAKACWACHISKTKCSPCFPGHPCEQCARLVDKRRFCKFKCFNDPLEFLHTFLVPDYVMGNLTASKVEAFISENATGWGTHHLLVQLSWGYRRLLEADVVTLTLSNNSNLSFSHHAVANGSGRPALSRRESPPLGMPLAVMEELGNTYSLYVRNIVDYDLRSFVSITYDDQDCKLPEQLLGAVCSYYMHGLKAQEESRLLRQAIEMHVTATILERSLTLTPESINLVQNHLQQEFPPKAVPRCAQRQIKLAFFTLQRKRIFSVLKEWGTLMWTMNNSGNSDKKWAMGFSVFVLLTLVIDKTLESAYYYCQGKIAHYGVQAEAEDKEFRKLVRLTQTELFERCKEIFHWKFKTRKAGKESCNPIRDGMEAFRGRPVDAGITGLVHDLGKLTRDYDREIRAHTTFKLGPKSLPDSARPYTDAGRMACILLDDFLERP